MISVFWPSITIPPAKSIDLSRKSYPEIKSYPEMRGACWSFELALTLNHAG
jgi:hypothetical protein